MRRTSIAHFKQVVVECLTSLTRGGTRRWGTLAQWELLKSHPKCPLHEASRVGDSVDVLNLLMDNFNVNVNAKSAVSYAPLHLAAMNGHTIIVEHLLNRGAEVESRAIDGCTTLHLAAKNDHTIIVEHLLTRGADINSKNHEGNTPLFIAASCGCINKGRRKSNRTGTTNRFRCVQELLWYVLKRQKLKWGRKK